MIDRAGDRLKAATFEELQRQEQELVGELSSREVQYPSYKVAQLEMTRAELERRRIVRVGVAVFLFDYIDRDQFILMKRRGSHGAGTWGLPGGHIEYGEGAVAAAAREISEELQVAVPTYSISIIGVSEAVFPVEHKHYITVMCRAMLGHNQLPKIVEPEKCEELRWAGGEIELPDPLFPPLSNFIAKWGTPTLEHPRGR